MKKKLLIILVGLLALAGSVMAESDNKLFGRHNTEAVDILYIGNNEAGYRVSVSTDFRVELYPQDYQPTQEDFKWMVRELAKACKRNDQLYFENSDLKWWLSIERDGAAQ